MSVDHDIAEKARELASLDLQTDGGVERAEALVSSLEGFGRGRAVVPLLPLLTAELWNTRMLHRAHDRARQRRVAEAARAATSRIVAQQGALTLVAMDQAIRARSVWRRESAYMEPWDRFEHPELDTVVPADGTERLHVLSVFASHPNGYVREAALVELAKLGEAALPWLLLRANDWVLALRVRAATAVLALLEEEHAEAFIRWLPLVVRRRAFSRASRGDLAERITRFILSLPDERFEQGMGHGDRDVRRAVLGVLIDGGRASLTLVQRALADTDMMVRRRAALFIAAQEGPEWEALQDRLCRDRIGQVRALGLELLLQRDPARAEPYLRAGLDDPTRSVRDKARFHLKARHPELDLVAHYWAAIEERPTVGSIRGLGEEGGANEDWERLFPSLDARPSLARAALVTMARLNASESRETRLMMVDSKFPGVSKEAARTLLQGDVRPTDEPTLEQYLRSPKPHVRRNAVRLLSGLPGWAPARHLLSVESEALRSLVDVTYGRWLSRLSVYGPPPSEDEAARLRALLRTSPLVSEWRKRSTSDLLDFVTRSR